METLTAGTEFRGFPSSWSENKIVTILAAKHGVKPEDFKFIHGVCVYSPIVKKTRKKTTPTSKTKNTITCFKNIDGEVWKRLPNKSRYFNGELDPSHSVEVSNMGRVKVDGKLRNSYFAETRNAVQVHIDTYDIFGTLMHTTGFVANMVADAFIVPNGADGKTAYSIIYKDNDPRNVKLSNLIVVEK